MPITRIATIITVAMMIPVPTWAQGRFRAGGWVRGADIGPKTHVQTAPGVGIHDARSASHHLALRTHSFGGYRAPRVAPYLGPQSAPQAYGHGGAYMYSYFGGPYRWRYFYPRAYWPTYVPHYTYSPYFPYLYFYELYYREAERDRAYWRDYEATVRAEEAKLSGAEHELVAMPNSAIQGENPALGPRLPREVLVTIDEQELPPSSDGRPLLIGSGRHVLRVAGRPAASATSRSSPDN